MVRLRFTAPLLIAVFALTAFGQPDLPNPAGQAPPAGSNAQGPTKQQQISYAVGYDFGMNLHAGEADLDPQAVVEGLTAGLMGKKSPFTDEQLGQLLDAFEQKMKTLQVARMKQYAEQNLKTAKTFLADMKKEEGVVETKSGLLYKIIKQGQGPSPTAQDTVRVHYHGTHVAGTVFDSSKERGQPAMFGVGQVIRGWTEALQLMHVGDTWQVFIPPAIGYGEKGTPGGPIGPNEVLIFEVELLEIVPRR